MNSTQTRVRFAPSPTGFLHIGGARTALFNWLYARANNGAFLIRIEDTDRERSESRFTEDILASLKWLGLNWDEEPVYQSKRFDRYQRVAKDLLEKGKAYYCECTSDDLTKLREQAEKEKRPFRYPGVCRKKGLKAEGNVLRIVTPTEGETGFDDLIRGNITLQNKDIDNWIILRADGSPTYNFSVVIDDHDQGITHILRGDDHINNTPKQILLYRDLGFEVPHFAHLPMILGSDRTKLSKRHGAASTLEYRKMGYLPEALVNFLVRLGWSHGDQEIFTIDELKSHFSLAKIGKANAIFNVEKLDWISGHFFRSKPALEMYAYLKKHFSSEVEFLSTFEEANILKGISIIQGKVKHTHELIEQLRGLFGEDPKYDFSVLKEDEQRNVPKFLKQVLGDLEKASFSHSELDKVVRSRAEALGIKLTPLAQAIRFAITGGKVSPGLFDMLEVLGKERVLRRIQNAISAFGA